MSFFPFLLGFIASYVGSITPSMLNITAVKIGVEKSKSAAKKYAYGISFVVVFQSFFALYFLKIILNNPTILSYIERGATLVFALLSFYFLKKALQEATQVETAHIKMNDFFGGIFLSIINLFSIPFYVGVGALFNKYHWIQLNPISLILFSIGSFLGTYLILYHYILFADTMKTTITKFSKYFNYVLSGITGIVAIISLIKML